MIRPFLRSFRFGAAFLAASFSLAATASAAIAEEASEAEAYEAAVRDLERLDGPFPFYRRGEELLLELHERDFGRPFYCHMSLGTGVEAMNAQAGSPQPMMFSLLYRFQRAGDRIAVYRPHQTYVWRAQNELAEALRRSFPESPVLSLKVEARDPDRGLWLANVTPFLNEDLFGMHHTLGGLVEGTLNKKRTRIQRLKSFETSAVVVAELEYTARKAPSHMDRTATVPVELVQRWEYRVDRGYRPRLADPRVGYFTSSLYDFDRFYETDRRSEWVLRWDLRKRDPSAPLSPPVKPIVWTLDPSIPPEFRGAVRRGVLRWNKAFEAIGYREAIVVQDAPNDPDYHHADGRYNVIRWTLSPETAFAVALFRPDPWTGEILSASVTVDANMVASIFRSFDGVVEPLRETGLPGQAACAHDGPGMGACAYAEGLAESASMAWTYLNALAPRKPDRQKFAEDYLSDVVCHEIGHCLGLRHNFIASTHLSLEQLADDRLVAEQGVAASVMDYTPVNMLAVLKGSGVFFNPSIGAYDLFAVRYGYTDLPGHTPEEERPHLLRIASESGKPGHAYMSDEDVYNLFGNLWADPYVMRFDSSSDPVAYAIKTGEAYARLLEKLLADGEGALSPTMYASRVGECLNGIAGAGATATRFMGRTRRNRNFKGDVGEVPTIRPIPKETTLRLLDALFRTSMSAAPIRVSPEVKLSLMTASHAPLSLEAGLIRMQAAVLNDLLMFGLYGTAENWSRAPEDGLTTKEYLDALTRHICADLEAGESIGPIRRALQRAYLEALIRWDPIGRVTNFGTLTDVADAIRSNLLEIREQYAARLRDPGGLDAATVLHLRSCEALLDRGLSRSYGTGK